MNYILRNWINNRFTMKLQSALEARRAELQKKIRAELNQLPVYAVNEDWARYDEALEWIKSLEKELADLNPKGVKNP